MSTPLVTNWRKVDASELGEVDTTFYHELIGSLMYLVKTKPDINFLFNSLIQFMVDPRRVHWVAAKHVLQYLRGTMEYGLQHERAGGVRLTSFTDADWEGCLVDRKSSLACCFRLGRGVFSWFSPE